ncbi:MAG: hypothetical protein ACRDZ4_24230 [Egibacteraceae bacterium]
MRIAATDQDVMTVSQIHTVTATSTAASSIRHRHPRPISSPARRNPGCRCPDGSQGW